MRETEWEGAAAEGRGTDERNRVGRMGNFVNKFRI